MTTTVPIDALVSKLAAAVPDFDPTDQEVGIALLRQLASGQPVPDARLAALVGQPEEATRRALERWPGIFRDDEDRVIGFMGLTVVEMGDHRLNLNGRSLSAWCAWDTLFLPELLGATARVSSRCPATGEKISLTVGPAGVQDLLPRGAVVSFLVPDTTFDDSVIQSFCHYVHFFASAEAGARWTAEYDGTFLLSVEDAYVLGHRYNRAVFGSALAS